MWQKGSAHRHKSWGNPHPAIVEISTNLVSDHGLDALVHPLAPEAPTNSCSLEEHTPEQGHPTGSIEVHQLEDVDSTLESNNLLNLFKIVQNGFIWTSVIIGTPNKNIKTTMIRVNLNLLGLK